MSVKKDEEVTGLVAAMLQEVAAQLEKMSAVDLRNLVFIACNRVGMLARGGEEYTSLEEAAMGMRTGIDIVLAAYEDAQNGSDTTSQEKGLSDKAYFCSTIGHA